MKAPHPVLGGQGVDVPPHGLRGDVEMNCQVIDGDEALGVDQFYNQFVPCLLRKVGHFIILAL